MSAPYSKEAEHYLANETQFRLGMLTTETSHPVTRDVSRILQRDTHAGLALLNQVDEDILPALERVVESGVIDTATDAVAGAIARGNHVYFCGCGATGRLSIQMESWWRGFWQQRHVHAPDRERAFAPLREQWEDRVRSVMAGGEYALITSVERFEDYASFGREQLMQSGVSRGDVVFAVTEGGETSHVIGAAHAGADAGAQVFFVYNNPREILCEHITRSRAILDRPGIIEINLTTGPQAIAGSTRMQAATIETLVLGRVLENALYHLLEPRVSRATLDAMGFSPVQARSAAIIKDASDIVLAVRRSLPDLARLVDLEARTYREGGNFDAIDQAHPDRGYALYVAGDRSGVIVLTDTTERSPTFSTPPFRREDRPHHKASPVYLALRAPDNSSAWRSLLKRDPHGLDWDERTYERLLDPAVFASMRESIPAIGREDILRFRLDGPGVLGFRPTGEGNLVVATCLGDEMDALARSSMYTRTLARARECGGATGAITVTDRLRNGRVATLVDAHAHICLARSPLGVTQGVGLKLALNTLSTGVMTLLGRVNGNYMTYVTPTNKKLVDRATRLVVGLSGLSYDDANRYVFSVLEDTKDARNSGAGLPPAVNIAVVRAGTGFTTTDAIEALRQHDGSLQATLDTFCLENGRS